MVQGRSSLEMRYRYYFLEALALTIILFIVGFLIGLNIEYNRNLELIKYYNDAENHITTITDRLDISNLGKYTCPELIQRNFEIGNEIYSQALIFEEYEESAILTKSYLNQEHRKFDILRTLFWINSVKIKERCGNNIYDTIVYLYDYNPETTEDLAKQRVMSAISSEIKSSLNDRVVLIPIAKNLNISTLDNILDDYNYGNESALLIVNEKRLFFFNQTEDVRQYLNLSD